MLTYTTNHSHALVGTWTNQRSPLKGKGVGLGSWRSALHSASSELCRSNEITPRSGPNVLEQAGDCKSKIKQARWSGQRALLVNANILSSVRN